MNAAGINSIVTDKLFRVIEQCEAGMFTNAKHEQGEQSLLAETKAVLQIILPSALRQAQG